MGYQYTFPVFLLLAGTTYNGKVPSLRDLQYPLSQVVHPSTTNIVQSVATTDNETISEHEHIF